MKVTLASEKGLWGGVIHKSEYGEKQNQIDITRNARSSFEDGRIKVEAVVVTGYNLKAVGFAELLSVRVHRPNRHVLQLCGLAFLVSLVAERGTDIDPPEDEKRKLNFKI